MTETWEPPGQSPPPLFASSRKRAQWAIALLVAIVMLDLLSAMSTWLEIGLFERAMAGASISEAEAVANDNRQAMIGLLVLAVWIGSCVAFLLWAHRAHRNLPSLGVGNLRFKPRDAIIYFFIPILNLFRPLQVMKETWYGSHPATGRLQTGRPSMAVVGWWWGLFLITNWIAWRASVAGRNAERVEIGKRHVDGR
jgi:hypothetical protein